VATPKAAKQTAQKTTPKTAPQPVLEPAEQRDQQPAQKPAQPERDVNPTALAPPENASEGPPVVGIGASAGGLDAFEHFFRACPQDSGLAFVLIPHLDPEHESILTEILQRTTKMPVIEAVDQLRVAPNHVYVIAPNREMTIVGGVLRLSIPDQPRGQRMPIDGFFRSLAKDQAERAIGIILSGMGMDGTQGLRAIFGAGGLCLVQKPSTAKHDGMPLSAIASGVVTHILTAEEMPATLQTLTHEPDFSHRLPRILPSDLVSGMNQILLQVRASTGHDFSHYKQSTISRRIARRMTQHNIEDWTTYASYLKSNPAEVQALFKELLINVTSFFRDPEAFVVLKRQVLPALLANKPANYAFRVWVAGCATGEEAYSIAIVLQELLDELSEKQQPAFSIQIYATDLDDDAIAVARKGIYPLHIAQDMTPERLQRFFLKEGAGYKVKKEIREIVIFAVQNVIKDPPFTKLDLLSCRNLMIYLEPDLQNQLIPKFHHALKPNGALFLSASESIPNHPELFSPLDRKWKFYRRNHAVPSSYAMLISESVVPTDKVGRTASATVLNKPKVSNVADLSHRALLQSYAPPSVTTDILGNILFVHGDTGRYLRPAPGPVTTNVVEMAREGLHLELRTAVLRAASEGVPTLNHEVLVQLESGLSLVRFSVRVLPGQAVGASVEESLLLLSFQDVPASEQPAVKRGRRKLGPTGVEAGRVAQLEQELSYAKEHLEATIEAQQAATEELKSINEELQSTNEELQSSNEELETSKEEMESLNEEVLNANAELNAKIEQLSGVQNDMKNLFDSISTGVLFLDHQLLIRRYTREAVKIFPLIPADVGRPLEDIKSNLMGDELFPELQSVLDTLIPCEREVQTIDGTWYLAHVQPYRTIDNVIEGVVLSFTEVTDFKLANEAVRRNGSLLETAQEIAHLGSWELHIASGQMQWSAEMFRIFGYPAITTTMTLTDILRTLSPSDREQVTEAIQMSVSSQVPYDLQHRITRPDGTPRDVHARARPVVEADGRVTRLIGCTLDVSEMRQTLASGDDKPSRESVQFPP